MEQFYEVEAKIRKDNGRPYIMPVRSVISLWLKLGLTNKKKKEEI
jgi:hypothetical protein